jgi:hypothetical protein
VATKKARAVRVVRPGLVRITEGGKVEHYAVKPIANELGGRAFEVRKVSEAQPYHVRIGRERSCECLAFCRRLRCRHVEALVALDAAGKI